MAKSWSICLRDEPPQMDTQMFLLLPAGFKEENVRGLASGAALCGVLCSLGPHRAQDGIVTPGGLGCPSF